MKFNTKTFKENWKPGITVALVSIPLSISLAVASGASPIVGIITGIWACLVASIFGGSHFNIIGPAGALSGILAAYALKFGPGCLAMLAIISGVFIIGAYLLKVEKYLVYVPSSTVQGFTLGVAIVIALNQINYAFGLNNLAKHEKFIQNVWESFKNFNNISIVSIITFGIFLISMFILSNLIKKVPAAIILTPIGILLGFLVQNRILDLKIDTLASKFSDIKPALFSSPTLILEPSLLIGGLTVALIAILETLLSAKVADSMTKTKHNPRQEMLGLGLANIISGLTGGMPATGVLVRTSLNIKNGATHKSSATIAAISVAVISLAFISYLKFLPLPLIAAILVFAAIKMIEMKNFVKLFHTDKRNFIIALIVTAVTVIEDPIYGIFIGTFISLLILVEKISKAPCEMSVNDIKKNTVKVFMEDEAYNIAKIDNEDTLVYSIKGELIYLTAVAHFERFAAALNGYQNVVIRLRELYYIDMDGIDTLDKIIALSKSKKRNIAISGVNGRIVKMLKNSDYYSELIKNRKVFKKAGEALKNFKVKFAEAV